jgi:group I intron endonuclease
MIMIIYGLKNRETEMFYIGQTAQALSTRIAEHMSRLSRGKHHNAALQKDFLQFGPEVFEATILDTASNMEQLDELEDSWIEKLKASTGVYNIAKGGRFNAMTGRKHREGTKAVMSVKAYARKYTPEQLEQTRRNGATQSRPVICVTTGIEYKSVTEAASQLKTKRARIIEVLTGKKKTWKGLQFDYKD